MKKIFFVFGLFLLLGAGKSFAQNSAANKDAVNTAVAPSVSAAASDQAVPVTTTVDETVNTKSANSETTKSCCKKGSKATKSCCSSKGEAKKECGHNHSEKTESKKEIKDSGTDSN